MAEKGCPIHPKSEIIKVTDEFCFDCTLKMASIINDLKKGSITRRERAIFLWTISESHVPEAAKEKLANSIKLVECDKEKRCIECASPLDKDGNCLKCSEHYAGIIFGDADITEEQYEEIMDACISDESKLEFLSIYEIQKIKTA